MYIMVINALFSSIGEVYTKTGHGHHVVSPSGVCAPTSCCRVMHPRTIKYNQVNILDYKVYDPNVVLQVYCILYLLIYVVFCLVFCMLFHHKRREHTLKQELGSSVTPNSLKALQLSVVCLKFTYFCQLNFILCCHNRMVSWCNNYQ